MSGARQPVRGQKIGDRRVVVERGHARGANGNGADDLTGHAHEHPVERASLLSRLSGLLVRRRADRPGAAGNLANGSETDGETLRGRKLGDRRVVIARPHARYFRYSGPGVMVAKASASAPRTRVGRLLARSKAVLIGKPLATAQEIEERLSKTKALAIFSSDAISSSAYAVDEILKVLILAGLSALLLSVYFAAAIALMLAIVAFSYRQLCVAYPRGGGAYVVAKENLGMYAGLIAAAALMIDYVMTVAVSTAAAIANLEVAIPDLNQYRVALAVISVVLVTTANLRGLRESGNIFALPTYVFIATALLAITVGLVRVAIGDHQPIPTPPYAIPPGTDAIVGLAGLSLLFKAFAGGSVALTGVEAIADGVAAFKPPEPKNAGNTLIAMAVLLGTLFIGLAFVGMQLGVRPTMELGPTVLGQVSAAVFGDSVLFYVLQGSAALVLFLAANTSFNAFPRLAAILAQDGYMPRQFSFRGDRLAFSWGIAFLSGVAVAMLIAFDANVHRLIPLYSVGVFVCFTLAQVSLVLRWRRMRGAGWRRRALINGFGALLTFTVFVIVAAEKLFDGAWLVLCAVPILVGLMLFVRGQYDSTARQLELEPEHPIPDPHRHNQVIIPIGGVNRAVVHALNVARSISTDIRAIYISDSEETSEALRARWARQFSSVPLVIVESPYRALVAPLVAYLDVLQGAQPKGVAAPMTFVLVPEYVPRSWWERILYNQAGKQLRKALTGRPHTVVIGIQYRRDERPHDQAEVPVPAGSLLAAPEARPPEARPPEARPPDERRLGA
jgi:amino acid transporter